MSDGERVNLQILGFGLARLGSVTAALAARLMQAPTHPAEHVLDESRAFYREEEDGKRICVECDQCKVQGPGASSGELAQRLARDLGWSCGVDYDFCPPHARAQLTAGDEPPLLPALNFSVIDLILLRRLDWIANRIVDRTSPEAALNNSNRTGSRHMLTDLGSQFHYNPAELGASVDELRTRGAPLPEAFRSDAEGKTFEWIAELFAHVCAEDKGVA